MNALNIYCDNVFLVVLFLFCIAKNYFISSSILSYYERIYFTFKRKIVVILEILATRLQRI